MCGVFGNCWSDTVVSKYRGGEQRSGLANLEIYDLMGRKLAKVFEGQVEKGIQKTVDYRVPQAQRIPLIYRLTIGDKTSFGKLVPGSTD